MSLNACSFLFCLQRRQQAAARVNTKSSSHHYTALEDSVAGFRMEPPAAPAPSTMQMQMQSAGQFGSTWYRKDEHHQRGGMKRTTSSLRVSNLPVAHHLTSQRSCAPSRGGTDLHPSSSAVRNTNSKYNRLDVAEPANALDRPGPGAGKKDMGIRDAPSAVSVAFILALSCCSSVILQILPICLANVVALLCLDSIRARGSGVGTGG